MEQANRLTREQKEAVGLLSIGTFLEYFDLMLYVHMAVLLNELFFPKYDPFTNSLLTAFAFCSTYLLRPFGALLFGYIGDNIGRKHTIIITTFFMAFSSIVMFLLPTYAQIGITASWLVTICRMVQGMASMGELVGAILYLTELIKSPKNYIAVGIVRTMPALGTFVALGVATIVIKYGFNWRYAFLFGAGVALVGSVARSALRETPEFIDAKKRLVVKGVKVRIKGVKKIVALSYFLIECPWAIWVYVIYIHYGAFLKNNLGYSAIDVIQHNLYISIVGYISSVITVYLASTIYPLQIMRIRSIIFCIFLPVFIFLLENEVTILNVAMLQFFMIAFHPTCLPADPIIFKYFPVMKRFFSASMLFAMSRTLMYLFTSFGIVYLTEYLGMLGLLIIIIPVVVGYFYGLNTFIKLEKEAGNYHKKTFWSIVKVNKEVARV